MNAFSDSDIINYVVRMVVPMRREFGRRLDVQLFMRDSSYAQQVLDEALTSQDTRLLDYARHVSRRVLSPRIAAQGEPPPQRATDEAPTRPMALDPLGSLRAEVTAPAAAAAPQAQGAAPTARSTEDEKALRKAMLKKYTSGLR